MSDPIHPSQSAEECAIEAGFVKTGEGVDADGRSWQSFSRPELIPGEASAKSEKFESVTFGTDPPARFDRGR
jgi:hypothetical protein